MKNNILQTLEKLENQLKKEGIVFSKITIGGLLGVIEIEHEYTLEDFKAILKNK